MLLPQPALVNVGKGRHSRVAIELSVTILWEAEQGVSHKQLTQGV